MRVLVGPVSAGQGGQLRRLARGLYDFPKVHPKLGALSPTPDNVAQALARETGSLVQIAGARAANALGLSTQVPAQSTCLTDGPSRRVVLGKRVVDLRQASPKHRSRPARISMTSWSATASMVSTYRFMARSYVSLEKTPNVMKVHRNTRSSERMANLSTAAGRQAPLPAIDMQEAVIEQVIVDNGDQDREGDTAPQFLDVRGRLAAVLPKRVDQFRVAVLPPGHPARRQASSG